ncbi:MAG: ion transporter [Aquabacterium sp.]|nr:ion transporter [Aquabacterium sp.]
MVAPSGRGWRVDAWLHWLILANVATLFLEHVPVLHNTLHGFFTALERVSMLVFCTEYLLRAWLAPEDLRFQGQRHARLRYLCSPLALVDLLALLPFVLPAAVSADLMGLRALRVLAALKWLRFIKPALADFRQANQGRSRRQLVHALVFPSPTGGQVHAAFDGLIVGHVLVSVLCVMLESVHSIKQAWALELHLVDLRFMRVLRLVRLLKLTRNTGATDTLKRVLVRESPVLGWSPWCWPRWASASSPSRLHCCHRPTPTSCASSVSD